MLLSTDDSVSRLTVGGLVLGAFPERSYEQSAATIAAGGRLLMFTDGITEAENASGEEFGDERLLDVLRAHPGGSAAVAFRVPPAVVRTNTLPKTPTYTTSGLSTPPLRPPYAAAF